MRIGSHRKFIFELCECELKKLSIHFDYSPQRLFKDMSDLFGDYKFSHNALMKEIVGMIRIEFNRQYPYKKIEDFIFPGKSFSSNLPLTTTNDDDDDDDDTQYSIEKAKWERKSECTFNFIDNEIYLYNRCAERLRGYDFERLGISIDEIFPKINEAFGTSIFFEHEFDAKVDSTINRIVKRKISEINSNTETSTLKKIKNFAKSKGCSTAYIYKLIANGKLKSVSIDGVHFIDTSIYVTA